MPVPLIPLLLAAAVVGGVAVSQGGSKKKKKSQEIRIRDNPYAGSDRPVGVRVDETPKKVVFKLSPGNKRFVPKLAEVGPLQVFGSASGPELDHPWHEGDVVSFYAGTMPYRIVDHERSGSLYEIGDATSYGGKVELVDYELVQMSGKYPAGPKTGLFGPAKWIFKRVDQDADFAPEYWSFSALSSDLKSEGQSSSSSPADAAVKVVRDLFLIHSLPDNIFYDGGYDDNLGFSSKKA